MRHICWRGPASIPPAKDLPTRAEWLGATMKSLTGIALIWGVGRLVPADQPLLFGWTGMVGLILMLHFGSFHLLSCAWRSLGVDARPLMNKPLASISISEFWGKRWNSAFRDLTHRFLFRPLNRLLGPRRAIVAGFLFSGIVHDLVISLPAGGGYGLPTLFFGIQAAAMFAERSPAGNRLGLMRSPYGRIFTMVVLILPAFWLFHPPFVRNIIVPFLLAIGAR
jgi:D-alanyl-lipoteichoic acid acyltransferase DltB (MBOAT superfamily)